MNCDNKKIKHVKENKELHYANNENEQELINKEQEIKKNLLSVYDEAKNLFIDAEELFPEMKLFAAPTLEHRDALEHIIRYINLMQNNNLKEAVEEIDKALGHELRAYFDIADYVSILIRDNMRKTLCKYSQKRIHKKWDKYEEVKVFLFSFSEDIASVRKKKIGKVQVVEEYKTKLDNALEYYKEFEVEIEPALMRKIPFNLFNKKSKK